MAEKRCDKCQESYKGFGTTCAGCRKSGKADAGTSGGGGGGASSDKCHGCGKVAYAMERIVVEEQTWHPSCWRCTACDGKLTLGKFSKAQDGKFYCKVHYMEMFKLRGRYPGEPEGIDRVPSSSPRAEAEAEAAPAVAAATSEPKVEEAPPPAEPEVKEPEAAAAPAATAEAEAKVEEAAAAAGQED
mmetsp:Transcript_81429/g.264390  ORF Transcript_81429/g.264390 Transcript_81429/m.264390 type:complete len:187 (-) Transcript_81429:238-798(-)